MVFSVMTVSIDFLGSEKLSSQHGTEFFSSRFPASEIPRFGKKVDPQQDDVFLPRPEQSCATLVLRAAYLFVMDIILTLIYLK